MTELHSGMSFFGGFKILYHIILQNADQEME